MTVTHMTDKERIAELEKVVKLLLGCIHTNRPMTYPEYVDLYDSLGPEKR